MDVAIAVCAVVFAHNDTWVLQAFSMGGNGLEPAAASFRFETGITDWNTAAGPPGSGISANLQADAVAASASGAGTRTPRKRTNAATDPTAANATRAANAQW